MAGESSESPSVGQARRAARRRETRRRILDTAMEILVDRGHEGFTIAHLASELDYAVGALYRYFKGKDAILAALQHRIVTQLEEDVRHVLAHVDKAHPGPGGALVRLFSAMIIYESLTWRRPTDNHVLALSLGDPRPLLRREEVDGVLPALESLLSLIGQELTSCVTHDAIRPGNGRDRALVLWGSTYGVMALRKLERVSAEFIDPGHARSLHVGLIVGWGAPQEDAEGAYDEAAAIVRTLFVTGG